MKSDVARTGVPKKNYVLRNVLESIDEEKQRRVKVSTHIESHKLLVLA